MGTDVGNSSSDIQVNEDSDLKSLEQDFKELQDEAQRLLSERVHLENDLANIKKRASRLDEEVRILKSPPLIIGHLQDVLDDERAIVRSSNGTVFQVSINQRLDPTKLKPGTRIALNQDTLSIIEILHDAWEPTRFY
jgi:proteasome regulatory subunit